MAPANSYGNPSQDLSVDSNNDPIDVPQGESSPGPHTEEQSHDTKAGYIGLAFSGGGYRAAAYSLGTMALLQDLKLLGETRVLSGVSGGSLAVGAYLCGKAGSGANSEKEFDFYRSVYIPLMLEMDNEDFAAAFVSLPGLLQGQKLILRAADATQALMSRLLGEEASFGNERLTKMLSNSDLSPDYAFFNTTNISSLDLFRFGIQKGRDAISNVNSDADGSRPGQSKSSEGDIASTAYILNRYLLRPDARGVGADLREHAKLLRIGDCIASSYAFPGGFDPLIFPNDFFRPKVLRPGQDWAAAREAFSGSLICDQKPYIAFLDGGLYDNLGLASVEDIRAFLARKAQEDGSTMKPIRYVIATDVDNINPANSAYREPSLERHLGSTAQSALAAQAGSGSSSALNNIPIDVEWPSPSLCRPARLVLRNISLLFGLGFGLGLGVALLFGWPLGPADASAKLGLASQLLRPAVFARLIGLGLVAFLLWQGLRGWRRLGLGRLGRSGWLKGRLDSINQWWSAVKEGAGLQPRPPSAPEPTWTMRLGLSKSFQSDSIDLDVFAVLRHFLWKLVRSADPAPQVRDLKTALIERRLGQLGPAFSGYLKRTRSLTYGLLEQSYAQKRRQAASQMAQSSQSPQTCLSPEHCYLIRNMIFELIPGPDLDPDQAVNLITLPIKEFYLHRQGEPLQPIMRKLRHAELVVELIESFKQIDRPSGVVGGKHPRPIHGQRLELAQELICDDPDFNRITKDLHIKEVALIWTLLKVKLVFEPGDARPQAVCAAPIAEPIGQLVETVLHILKRATMGSQRHGNDADTLNDTGFERELRERCTIKLGDSADSYSWIPLICEMATNLSTTLWAQGFRWYALNKLEIQQIKEPGGWYSYLPSPSELRCRTLLDFGENSHAALKITALAGYLSMAFNLLEFVYGTLGASDQAAGRLALKLAAILSESTPAKQIGINQPHQPTRPDQNKGSGLDSSTKQDDLFKQISNLPFKLRQKTFQRLHGSEFSLQPHQLTMLEPWLISREGSPETWR